MNNTYRHGDLVLTREDIDVSALKHVGDNTYILAEGETTGHKHVMTKVKESTVDVYLDEKTNELVIKIDGKASLVHEEHKELIFETGTYRMKHQREYDYFGLNSRQVID